MELNYELDLNDILEFNIFHIEQSKTIKRNLTLIKISLPIIFILLVIINFIISRDKVTTLIIGIPLLVTSITWFLISKKMFIRSVKSKTKKMLMENKNNGITGPQKIIIEKDQLIEIDKSGKTERRNKFLNNIKENDKYYFLYLTSITAIVIPKNIFKDNDQEQEFKKLINNFLLED